MNEDENYQWRRPRVPGKINWYGMWTLYKKEVNRFFKIFFQTIAAPIATSLLFMTIFIIALGDLRPDINGAPFIEFLAPGLIMMSVLQQAFAHTSSSLLISKIQGNIVDILMPPIGEKELNIAISMGGVTRGVVVAAGAIICMYFFVNFRFENIWAIFFYGISGSLLLSSIGIITGIWAEKFDHLGTITNFIIVPLSFLSGTFYSVKRMPDFAFFLIEYNPFFYIIDGFRYDFVGVADGDLLYGAIFLTVLNLILIFINHYLFKSGWRLKT
ncbi:MAG: ABC transporter permease [Pseudomonadota bacterium]|nr:ABC transporter permease [Pseudomonadota bacterium]